MNREYETLRQEILAWQGRRFTVTSGNMAVVVALVGWFVTSPDKWSWDLASALVFSCMAVACYMIAIMTRFLAMIGTYLEIFHGSEWEMRSRKLRHRKWLLTMGPAIALLYSLFAGIGLAVSVHICSRPPTVIGISIFVITLVFFLMTALMMVNSRVYHEEYLREWAAVRDREDSNSC